MSTPPAFAEFYAAARGRMPLPWMHRLADDLVAGDWPDVMALPTGSAKTEIIAIWAWALAVAPHVPRRLWMASDRRVIADRAHQLAVELAQRLADRAVVPTVQAVAEALRAKAGGPDALRAGLLRGGITLDDDALIDPLTPLAVATTVDQIGSRLLFRAYGASPRAWPIWAGLAGEDSLIVLDEAHLSAAAEATFRRAQMLGAGVRLISMTATPRPNAGRVLSLDAIDEAHPVLRQRLEARRVVVLRKAADVGEAMATAAFAAMASGAKRLAIVCNTVRRAREVMTRLEVARTHERFLVIGRSRPLDRQLIMERLEPRVASGASISEPLVVVSTQCIEAGADFDFDAMVSEACPLDALRQRLGRLDRLGTIGLSRCVLVAPNRVEAIPPYGDTVAAAWTWLERVAGKKGEIDLGIAGWAALAAVSPPPLEATSAHPPTVTLLEPHLRLLARTWPRPAVEPEIDLLLHGRGHRGGDVSLVWRGDVVSDDEEDVDASAEILEVLPPLATEALQVPVWEVRRWLAGMAAGSADAGDVEGALASDEPRGDMPDGRAVLRWLGAEDGAELVRARDIRPGDVLVVPAAYGGCDTWGWAPAATEPVVDLGDAAWSQKRGYSVHRVPLSPDQELDDLRVQEAGPGQRIWVWAKGVVVEHLPPKVPLESRHPEVTLDAHTARVVAKSRSFAEALGLDVADFELAARWHDVGKDCLPWQIMIKGGDLRRLAEAPLAKGKPLDPHTRARVQRLARLPAGWRHEAESLRRLDGHAELKAAHDADLVRWLVASHHGYARPWWPVVEGLPPNPGLAALMTRLGRRLGWWRLAWLEAVFRCADRTASREEQAADA